MTTNLLLTETEKEVIIEALSERLNQVADDILCSEGFPVLNELAQEKHKVILKLLGEIK